MRFMMGAATAAHQVEGNNRQSDAWVMENVSHTTHSEPSGMATDHYNRFKEDIDYLKKAGLNTYRFSIEWARVEPVEGQFDRKEIEHYRSVLAYCHAQEIIPVVTLHHFTSPVWVIQKGGWESPEIVTYFANYAQKITEELGDLLTYICTINEANMGSQIRKVMLSMAQNKSNEVQVGMNLEKIKESQQKYYMELSEAFNMPPDQIFPFLSPRSEAGEKITFDCHQRAREVIKQVNPKLKVGLTLSIFDNQSEIGGEELKAEADKEEFIDFLPYIEADDFLGVQNYTRKIFNANGEKKDDHIRVTKMGYEFYPQGIEHVIRFVNEHWKKEIFVTENGLSTDDDKERIEYIDVALQGIKACVDDGLPVVGYTYWSLLDNFEWQLGYKQTFGLIAVNRVTMAREPKQSLTFLGTKADELFN
ncbi:glycoside hydrolase family 1 protein [Candidatus Enterococcus huntleyi]|uniref:glycoside hydrolase family 1 protein n=1 Tax=Candidatus Enterococcus huntleyi TaxID=1857217 RepID=UPI00192A59C4|nr:family 1 glycosylhydrolase [Enterococcus sp. JM4C]